MPSFEEIARLGTRMVTINVRGLPIKVLENLMRNPALETSGRKQLTESLSLMESEVSDLRKSLDEAMKTADSKPVAKKGAKGKKQKPGKAPIAAEELPATPGQMRDAIEGEIKKVEVIMRRYKLALDQDDRMMKCMGIVDRVRQWDLTDVNNVPLPLDVDALYSGEFAGEGGKKKMVPTLQLAEILQALDSEEIIPEASSSPSKKPSTEA